MKSFFGFIILFVCQFGVAQKLPDFSKTFNKYQNIHVEVLQINKVEFKEPDSSFQSIVIHKKSGKSGFEKLSYYWPDSSIWYITEHGHTKLVLKKNPDSIYHKSITKVKRNQYPTRCLLKSTPLVSSFLSKQLQKEGKKIWDSADFVKYGFETDQSEDWVLYNKRSGLLLQSYHRDKNDLADYATHEFFIYNKLDSILTQGHNSTIEMNHDSFISTYKKWYQHKYSEPHKLVSKPVPSKLKIKTKNGFIQEGIPGKKYILDFFYLSCYPCQMSFPEMMEFKKQYEADTNVVFIYVNSVDDSTALARMEEKKQFHLNYCLNPTEVESYFDVHSHPTFIILDADFDVKHKEVGFEPKNTVARLVWKL